MLALGALLHVGCACEPIEFHDTCTTSPDSCGAGMECGCFLSCTCEPSCVDVGCPKGQVCAAGLLGGHQCELGCNRDDECDPGSYCESALFGVGKCVSGCIDDSPCRKGFACNTGNGRCESLPCHGPDDCASGYTCIDAEALVASVTGQADAGSCRALSSGCEDSQNCTCIESSWAALCHALPTDGGTHADASVDESDAASADAAPSDAASSNRDAAPSSPARD